MNEMLILIIEYGLYIALGIILLSAICCFAIRNAEDCPHPSQCFDCSETSCLKCCYQEQKERSNHYVWKPTSAQPMGALWFRSRPPH